MKPWCCRAGRPARRLLSGCCALVLAASAWAQTPESLVLALDIASDTHARPVSGVAITEDGLVLVPADFVQAGDRILVLDGGNDLDRHGRETRLVARSAADGVAVLRVEGLSARFAPLTRDTLRSGRPLTLAAFPRAEQLADGAPAISRSLKLARGDDAWVPEPAPGETTMAGPVYNRCGQVAGLYLPADDQHGPRIVPAITVLKVLSGAALTPDTEWCDDTAPEAVAQRPDQNGPRRSELEVLSDRPSDPSAAEPEFTLPARLPPDDDKSGPQPPLAGPSESAGLTGPASQSSDPSQSGLAWPWPAVAGLVTLLVGGILWARRRRRVLPVREANDTARGKQYRVELTVDFDTGQSSRTQATLAEGGAALIFGRGEGALRINHPSVQVRHASLRVHAGRLYIEPLDVAAQVDIAGLPCLSGEQLEVREDDALLLGEVPCRLALFGPLEPPQ